MLDAIRKMHHHIQLETNASLPNGLPLYSSIVYISDPDRTNSRYKTMLDTSVAPLSKSYSVGSSAAQYDGELL